MSTFTDIYGVRCAPEYSVWEKMRGRCNCKTNPDYHRYGGRGIKVCERWDDFEVFLADMGDRPNGAQIDRIDVNGNYCPENCRWVTSKINNRNRRDNILITIDGETKCLADWAELRGVRYQLAFSRWWRGLPVQEVFSTSFHSPNRWCAAERKALIANNKAVRQEGRHYA